MRVFSCAIAFARNVVSLSRGLRFFVAHAVRTLARPAPALKFVAALALVGLFASLRANALVSPTAPVGATAGSFAVGPTGAATYTIPIAIPPGTHGMQPAISLVYDSQAGNGLVGMGWAIAGLSVIQRCGATIEVDGFKGGVNYDANDRFCLDGERLIKISATEYRTQRESLQRVIASDGTTNPASFIVTSKDGTTREYGTTDDSRIEASQSTTVRAWALNKITDTSGNYLQVAYYENNAQGAYWPTRIDYAGRNGTSGSTSVRFEYEVRPDVTTAYEAGSIITTYARMTNVQVYEGTNLIRDYRLQYDTNGAAGRSRLTSVQECGTDGTCFPATTFSPQNGNTDYTQALYADNFSPQGTGNWSMYSADVNGDGKADLIFRYPSSNQLQVFLSNGDGTFVQALYTNSFSPQGIGSWEMQTADVNGDGKADLIFKYPSGNQLQVFLSNGDGTFVQALYTNNFSPQGTGNWAMYTADVNGDGRSDLIFRYPSSNQMQVFLSNGDGTFVQALYTNSFSPQGIGSWVMEPADVNGDGRTDLIFKYPSGNQLQVFLSNGDGTFVQALYTNSFSPQGTGNWTMRSADVNGDGKADLIFRYPSSNQLQVFLSRGDGAYVQALYTNSFSPQGIGSWNMEPADVNGDGKVDLIFKYPSGNQLQVFLSNGDGTFVQSLYTNSFSPQGTGNWAMYTADVNGDGKVDLVFKYPSSNQLQVFDTDPSFTDSLTSIRNGLGVTTSLSYGLITTRSVYVPDNDAAYPYADVQTPTYVVSSVSGSNGIGGNNTTTYQYRGLKKHVSADVSLGFRSMQVTDSAGLINITYYNQNREAGIDGTVASSQLFSPGGSVLLKSSTNTWVQSASGVCGGTTQPELTASVQQTFEPSDGTLITKVNTSTSYDACGFPITVVTDFNDGWKKTVNNTYAPPDTSNWILGLVAQTQVTAEGPGLTPQTRTSGFSYTPQGLLASETIEPGSPLSATTTYMLDGFGNRTTTTVSGADIATRSVETLGYDANGRFIVSRSNTLGQATTYGYDERALLVSQTDPNGLVTQWDYDGFGRKVKEVRPDGVQSTITYSATSSGYSVYTQTPGAASFYTFYDILGREIRTSTEAFGDNVWIYRDKHYDALGRLIEVSNPDFNSTPSYYTRYSYDLLGRVTSVTMPTSSGTGNTTTTAYNHLTTTVTNPLGQVATEVKNSQGKTVSVTDAAGGTTQYTYDVFGNVTTVTDALGNVTTLTYDDRGRKIAMHDPDMGNWAYSYDVLGELKSQTDAKNQTIAMAYDNLGRMTSRTTPEGTSNWSYDTAAQGKGKLASVSGPNGYQETYVYDSLSRPSQVTTTIGGQSYTIGSNYDTYGRPQDTIYPVTGIPGSENGNSGYTVRRIYTTDGYLYQLQRIKPDGTQSLLWQATNADAFGHTTQETFGNALASQLSFDPATADLLAIQTGDAGNPQDVQNVTYSFDALHNLTARSDAIAGLNETFGYDDLNRLTQATGTGIATKTYQYDAIGNITYKSDVGSYTYNASGPNSSRPHAVTGITGTLNGTYTYDADGNMTGGGGRTLTYTSFNKPQSIAGSQGTTTFTYDAGYNRIQKVTATRSTVYLGKLYEKVTTGSLVEHNHYVYAGNTLVALYTERNNGTAAETSYVHTDHLGSITVKTDANGQVIERLGFDPFGKRRLPNGQDGTITSSITRGYTGHEHDDEVGLINMNAREYDPIIGRFLTPDSVVDGAAGQGLNRYSYVRNNPLSLSDPTGHWSLRKSLLRVVQQVSQIKYVGGLLATGLLANPIFAPHYGLATSDWKSVGKAVATSAVLAASVYAGGVASEAYAQPILSDAACYAYTGPVLSGWQYVGANAIVAFNTSFAVARINGASTHVAWEQGLSAAKGSIPFTLIDIVAIQMRAAMVKQSGYDFHNWSGTSAGYRGDHFKLGGSRWPIPDSPLGGGQGDVGQFFGSTYDPGSIPDLTVEAFAGPHDWLSQWQYDAIGNTKQFFQSGIGSALSWAASFALLVPASPIVAGSVLAPYSAIVYSERLLAPSGQIADVE